MRHVKPLLALPLFVFFAVACSKKGDPPAPAAAPSATAPAPIAVASAVASAAASAPAAAVPAGMCKVEIAPFSVDKGARTDAGITLVRLPDDRLAVGYAVANGAPRVAIVSLEGSATVVDVDATKVPELAARVGAKETRTVHRVTPLASEGLKLRAAVDYSESRADGTRIVRCGPADDEPFAHFEGQSAYGADAGAPGDDELRDCRTFADGGAAWTLAFQAHEAAGSVDAEWRVRSPEVDAARGLIAHKAVPAESGQARVRAGQLDRYGYTLLASAKIGTSGYIAASRYNGRIALAKRSADFGADGDAGEFWLGAAVGMPALASRDAKVVVLAPIAGKLDLYGAAFPAEAKAPKPEKLTIADPPGAAALPDDAERTAVSVSIAPHRVFAAFLDGKSGKRRPRIAVLGETLASLGPAFEPLGADASALDVKLVALDDERALVAALVTPPGGPATIEAAIVSCAAAP
jgi:hypothetical protein